MFHYGNFFSVRIRNNDRDVSNRYKKTEVVLGGALLLQIARRVRNRAASSLIMEEKVAKNSTTGGNMCQRLVTKALVWLILGLFSSTAAQGDEPQLTPGEVTTIEPNYAYRGSSVWVSISGLGTHFGLGLSGETEVWFGQGSNAVTADIVDVENSTHLTAHFIIPENAEIGCCDISIYDDLFPVETLAGGFSVYTRCGDVDGNDEINVSDGVAIISYIFGEGVLVQFEAADADCNGVVNISDVVTLFAYIYGGGLPPSATCP